MTEPATPQTEQPSTRHVIEHALIEYGYNPNTARALIDRLVEEEAH